MRKLAGVVVLTLLGLVGTAHAESPPSAWDRAKRPEVQDEYQLHLTVRQVLISEELAPVPSAEAIKEGVQLRVLSMLQAAGAATSKNPILRYDLADVYMKTKQFSRAAETYKAAMRDFPDHPQTRHSRFELAIACGHIGDHECEEHMYRAVIAQSTSPGEIATPALNLAETEMHNHDLREAIEDYREALRLCNFFQAGPRTPALVLWGLAVALDRAGELREADEETGRALEMVGNRTDIAEAVLTDTNDVFFFPEYEVYWYLSITYGAAAKRAQTPRARLELSLQAERRMLQWITGAEKKKDYWLPIAKTRLDTYTKARKAAEVAVFKNPPPDPDDEGGVLMVPQPPFPIQRLPPTTSPPFPVKPTPRPPITLPPKTPGPSLPPARGDTKI